MNWLQMANLRKIGKDCSISTNFGEGGGGGGGGVEHTLLRVTKI